MTIAALILHFISDFLLQSREMGKNKSSNWFYLAQHLIIIFFAFLPFGLKFSTVNAIVHGLIDKNIWNVYKFFVMKRLRKNKAHPLLEQKGVSSSWKYWEDSWFYSTIGFDQLLHTLTLVVLIEVWYV